MASIASVQTNVAQFFQNLPGASVVRFTNLFSSKEETALNRAFAQFADHYRNEVDALFDEHFLTHAGESILNDFAVCRIDRHEAATRLAESWSDQLGPVSAETRKRRIRNVAMAADALLSRFEIELGRPQAIDRIETVGEEEEIAAASTLTLDAAEVKFGMVKLSAAGKLDADSYMTMVDKVQELYQRGARTLELDLGNVTDVQLSGLYALHAAAKIFRGESYPNRQYGLAGLRHMAEENLAAGRNEQLHLDSVNSAITQCLEQAGIYKVYAA